MLRAYQWEFHRPGGWGLEADVGYHKGVSRLGDWWEPEVHVLDPCEDKDVVG